MKNKKLINRSPYLYIVIGYLIVILVGSLLLMLPFCVQNGIAFIDALFVSTSAVCITGLSSVELAVTFTPFGKVVIALLVQTGGLGFTTVILGVLSFMKGKIGISEKFLVRETLGNSPHVNIKQILYRALLITFVFEFLGFLINLIALRNDFDGWSLVGYSAFHAISAFNNAGFDIFGSNSLIGFADNALLLLNLSFLTIAGGLGFIVINDLFTAGRSKTRRLSVHTKIVLIMTAILLVLGTFAYFFLEWGKIDFLNAFFMSAMTRTCGFASQDLNTWSNASILLTDFLMFIGAAPASTGGGVKVTTFFVVCASAFSFMRGKPTVVFHRRIGTELIVRSMRVFIFALCLVFLSGVIICIAEPQISTDAVFLEVISAYANVGLSMGITPELSVGCKALLCFAMYIGRLNFITVLMVFRRRWNRGDDESIHYVDADIIIG